MGSTSPQSPFSLNNSNLSNTLDDNSTTTSEIEDSSSTTSNNRTPTILAVTQISDGDSNTSQQPLQQTFTFDQQMNGNQIIVYDTELFNTLWLINPDNAPAYYDKCQKSGVNGNQLLKITELHMVHMFGQHEIGLLAEFTHDILKWQKSHTSEMITPTISALRCATTIASLSQVTSVPIALPTQTCPSSSNSLLSILSSNKALYNKAISISPGKPKTLNSREQGIIMNLISNHFINQCSNKMTYIDMEALADEIVKYFDGEDKGVYFLRSQQTDGSKKIKGKIPSKWNNRRQKENPVEKQDEVATCYTIPLLIEGIANEEEQSRIRLNLMANQSYPINMVIDEWKLSRDLRFLTIQQNQNNPAYIFSQWPSYTLPDGYILVSSMFSMIVKFLNEVIK